MGEEEKEYRGGKFNAKEEEGNYVVGKGKP